MYTVCWPLVLVEFPAGDGAGCCWLKKKGIVDWFTMIWGGGALGCTLCCGVLD